MPAMAMARTPAAAATIRFLRISIQHPNRRGEPAFHRASHRRGLRPLYGMVGAWPAFSCASRAGLSVASCAAVSFETNGPDAAVPGVGLAVVAADAAMVVAPYITAPATPPKSIDPAMAAAATDFRMPFMSFSSFVVNRSSERRNEG